MKRFIIYSVMVAVTLCVAIAAFAGCDSASASNGNITGGEAPPKSQGITLTEFKPPESEPTESEPPKRERAPSPDILLVNAKNTLPKDFVPESLVNLYERKDRHFALADSDIEVCEHVFKAMDAMFASAQKDGVDGFIVSSGYRPYKKQAEVFAATTDGTAAKPGESEHQTGLAFDVTAMGDENFELTPQFEWLSKHCKEYGFIIRYPKGMEKITEYPYEPWHYRYVGLPYSESIMDEGITLEQYLEREDK